MTEFLNANDIGKGERLRFWRAWKLLDKKLTRIKAGEVYDETWSSQVWAGIRPLFDALKLPLELYVTFDHNVLD